jgi:hypothetical protein
VEILQESSLEKPKSPNQSDSCEVTYSGTLKDGTKFDAGTTSFAPNQVYLLLFFISLFIYFFFLINNNFYVRLLKDGLRQCSLWWKAISGNCTFHTI